MQVILSHEAAGDLDHLIMPIALALTPEWLIILWLLHLEYPPLTKGALLGTVLIYLLSIPAVTLGLGYQNGGGLVALGFITLGYVVLLLLEGITAALRYRKRNKQARRL